jgi:hypothetical protein
MKWLTISVVPVFLTCLCFLCHKSQVGLNMNRLKSFPMEVKRSGDIVKDNRTGSLLFLDPYAVISDTDNDYLLSTKNIIVWIL